MATAHRTAVFYITERGRHVAQSIAASLPGAGCARFSSRAVKARWSIGSRLVFVMAAGIVVRTIAPLLSDKKSDPAVVVLDEAGLHVISLLSGHVGGANALAADVARIVGGTPVITTASDVSGLPGIDLWATEHGLVIDDWGRLPKLGTKLVNEGRLAVYSEVAVEMPDAFVRTQDAASADVVITNSFHGPAGRKSDAVVLRPGNLVAGIGCNSGTPVDEIDEAVRSAMEEHGLSFRSLRGVATIDRKGSEPGLVAFAARHGLPLVTYTARQLNEVKGVALSEAARKATGARAVAEPSAILGSAGGKLLVPKQKTGNVTVAIAETSDPMSRPRKAPAQPTRGSIRVVGTGPGSIDCLTPKALRAIEESDVVVGYGPYLDLVRNVIGDKETIATGMAREIDRCQRAIDLALEGRSVAVVSGGDPGIYAMAGLVLELLKKGDYPPTTRPSVEIVPGISALNACASRLGAPLMHDFAAISLSDRLTQWQTIEERLEAAARADFVIALYNPRSKGRSGHIEKACRAVLKHRSPDTPVGIVKGAMRDGERIRLTDLRSVPFDEIDMQTTVIIGNSKTFVWNDFMITPRGYENKKTR